MNRGQRKEREPDEPAGLAGRRPQTKWAVFWTVLLLAGLSLHLGSGLVRLATIGSYPLFQDFSGYYASVRLLALNKSPYPWSSALFKAIPEDARLPEKIARLESPPPWLILSYPFRFFSFPVAGWIWFALSMAMLVWISRELLAVGGAAKVGGGDDAVARTPVWLCRSLVVLVYADGKIRPLVVFALVLSFGPVVLTLMLGQNSLVLLAGALALGGCFSGRTSPAAGAAAFACAAAGKIYPVFWLGPLMLLQRWRLVLMACFFSGLLLGLTCLSYPGLCGSYWGSKVSPRLSRLLTAAPRHLELEDQSLPMFVSRLVMDADYEVTLVNTNQPFTISWKAPWAPDPVLAYRLSWAACALLMIPPVFASARSGRRSPEGNFYLWVLLPLIFFPHMTRYNLVLLLPAMAWLLKQGVPGVRLAVVVYGLVGLSRLGHVLVFLLPAPWGPLCSGFGLYAVLTAIFGMVWLLVRGDSQEEAF